MALKYIFGNKLWHFCMVEIGSQYACKIGHQILTFKNHYTLIFINILLLLYCVSQFCGMNIYELDFNLEKNNDLSS